MAEKPVIRVLCVRDPDASNDYTIEGDAAEVEIIDMDLGYADLDNWWEFAEWADSHLGTAADLPEGSKIRDRIESIVWHRLERNNDHWHLQFDLEDFPDFDNVDHLRTWLGQR